MRVKANYLIGNDPAEWRTAVPLFSKVQVDEVYPGVRLVYHADESGRLEYDFILQPGAKPGEIAFRVEGADQVRLDDAGNLILKIGGEEVRQHKPVIYQMEQGVPRVIHGGYDLSADGTVSFKVGKYDRHQPLIIDPVLSFSTYLGGSRLDIGWSIALDPAGNIYVAGETLSRNLVTTAGAFTPKYQGGNRGFGDAFVAKYDNTGSNLLYLTFLGGKTDDGALGLAVDASGAVYITGFTDSKNFPIVPANALRAQPTGRNNNALRLHFVDAFVAKLDPTGSSLVYSTLLGGDGRDEGVGIALDSAGNAYVAGLTESTNFFPISANAFQTNEQGNADVFVTKLVDGATFSYSTYLGGTNLEYPEGIAVDSGGSAYVTGFTASTNYPTINAIVLNGLTYTNLNTQTNRSFGTDAFVTRLSADGSALLFSTFLGGSNDDAGLGIALDASGNAYVTGYTFSTNFPATVFPVPVSGASNFTSHAFVTKLDANDNLIYSTQFGGSRRDRGLGIAVDAAGNAYVAGFTSSTNFFATNSLTDLRSTNAVLPRSRLFDNGFVAVLNPDASAFLHSIYIGGFVNDEINAIAVDPSGKAAFIAGQTVSVDFPLTTNAPQTTLNGGRRSNGRASDAFVGKISFP